MDTSRTVLRSARSFLIGTALSRVSGLFRDIAMAMSFGSSIELAAFMVSYRLANLLRRLLGEGNLNAAFVPHFTSLKESGALFYRDVVYSMSLILITIIVIFEVLLAICAYFVSADWKEVIDLTMWMLPGLFFICLYGLNSSLLQCRKKYFIPAIAPTAFNFIWIVSCFLFRDVKILAFTIVIAFAGQWFVTVFEGFQILGVKEWFKPRLFSVEFKKLFKPLLLGIIGIGAVQFNSALDAIFARLSDLKGPAFLWYAIRIQQLPIAFFGVALSGALLPPLSREIDPQKRKELLKTALKQGTSLMLICTFGIFALAEVGINLLFGHGDFTLSDVQQTSYCLWAYGLGLVPSIFVLILATHYYSQKDYRTPTFASLVSVLIHIALNLLFVFVFGWGAISVAIATSLSAFVNAMILSKNMMKFLFWKFFIKMSLANLLSFFTVTAVRMFWLQNLAGDLMTQTIQFIFLALLYLGVLGALSWKWGLKELMILRNN